MVVAERNSIQSADSVVGHLTQLQDYPTGRYSENSVALHSLSVVVVVEPDEVGLGIVAELAVVVLGIVAEPVELGIAVDVGLALDTVAAALDTVVVAAAFGLGNAAVVVAEFDPDKMELDPDIVVVARDRPVVAPLHVPDTAAGA